MPVLLLALLGAALVGVIRCAARWHRCRTLTEAAAPHRRARLSTLAFPRRATTNSARWARVQFDVVAARPTVQLVAAHAEIDAAILPASILPRSPHRAAANGGARAPPTIALLLLADPTARDSSLCPHGAAAQSSATRPRLPRPTRERLLADARRSPRFPVPRSRSVFALPITLGDELAGAIVLGYDAERPPDADEIAHAARARRPRRGRARHGAARPRAASPRPLRLAHAAPQPALGLEELCARGGDGRAQRPDAGGAVRRPGRLRRVNDSAGHAAGDQLLVQAGGAAAPLRAPVRLRRAPGRRRVRGGAARSARRGRRREAARNIIEALSAPFQVGASVFVSACVGIALYPGDGTDAEELLRHADLAMYHAKSPAAARWPFSSAR